MVCEWTPPIASEYAHLPLLVLIRSSYVGGGHVDTLVQSHYYQQPSGSPIPPVMPLGRHDSQGDTRIISFHANPILQEGKQRPGSDSSLTSPLVSHLNVFLNKAIPVSVAPINPSRKHSRSQTESLNASTASFSNTGVNGWIKYIPKLPYFSSFHTLDWRNLILQTRNHVWLHFQTKWWQSSADTCSNPTIRFFAQRLIFVVFVHEWNGQRIKQTGLLTILPAVFVLQSQVFNIISNRQRVRQKRAQTGVFCCLFVLKIPRLSTFSPDIHEILTLILQIYGMVEHALYQPLNSGRIMVHIQCKGQTKLW